MQTRSAKRGLSRLMAILLTVALLFALLPSLMIPAKAAYGDMTTETPALLVTGSAVIGGGSYSETNVGNEKSYTLEELKALTTVTKQYSAINTYETKKFYLAKGVQITDLLAGTAFNGNSDKLTLYAADGYNCSFDQYATLVQGSRNTTGFNVPRYYHPNLMTGDASGAVSVPTILAWSSATDSTMPTETIDSNKLTVITGQLSVTDQNNPIFNNGVNRIVGGSALTEVVLTVSGTEYTRADLLLMERATRTYTYTTKSGEKIDKVRGVPLGLLLAGMDQNEAVNFATADGYAVSANGKKVSELISGNYMIAYEKYNDATGKWEALYKSSGSAYGVLALYGDGVSPASMLNAISGATSNYKHIDSGNPYNIDALTSATLTVEGPGVNATTPIAIRDLESTSASNIKTLAYTNGAGTSYTYEGVDVLKIIDGAVNTNVEKEDENIVVVFKNRWRQDIAKIAYSDIKAASTAGTPVIFAYGVSNGTSTAPFVFDNATGYISAIDNDDGPIRLVYNPASFSNSATSAALSSVFSSCAYMYVEQGSGQPGYKHSEATDDAYDNPVNTEYLLTLTGSVLGREVNYTVAQLEAMVEYGTDGAPKPNGIGYRDSYGLSNTTYWYVNEYEGVNLWQLLTQKLGVNAATYKNDNNTLVTFSAWDNYRTTAEFSMAQLANPDLFYFYEKSPLDIGTNRPTKEQLATAEYQPTYSADDTRVWTQDANGYPVMEGYPVLIAYGVNGYPYVLNSKTDGYSGGLGNDGGPLKVIFGKANDMNRSNASAPDNYAYFYNNGSNQLQRAQEIYVGDDTRYSTHLENPAYTSMSTNSDFELTVEIITEGGEKTTKKYTLAQLESILYGADVTKRLMDTEGRQEKGYYAYKLYNDDLIEDLFEGVNLWYLLAEDIGLSSYLGTVDFYAAGSTTADASYSIADIQEEGYNSARDTSGLGMMVAFAKNGYPLVIDKNSAGYVNTDSVTGFTIKNSDGPLMFVRPQTAAERASGSVTTSGDSKMTVSNLKKIVINLEPDKYAHTPPASDNTIKFSGDVAAASDITIGTLETKQKYMVTDTFSIGGTSGEYRGLNLYSLLNDSIIGASALMESVTVKNAAGNEITLTVEDLMNSSKNIILAYGITSGGTGTPLTTANGGYMRLVINGGTTAQCITNVTEISVTAAEIDGWTHSFGNYLQYATNTLELSGSNLSSSKTYTVAEIEAMSSIVVKDMYQMGGTLCIEGVDLYKLLNGIGFASGLATSDITVYSSDGYATSFTGTDLQKGVNGKPILVAYGQGTTMTNGLPLVANETDAGFDPNIGNAYGPLRLVVNDNTGWCSKWITKIVVGQATITPPGPETDDFVITGYGDDIICNIGGSGDVLIKRGITAENTTSKRTGQELASYDYTRKDIASTDYVKGAYLIDLLEVAGLPVYSAGFMDKWMLTIETTDGYSHATYVDIPLSEVVAQDYFIAYDVATTADMSDAAAVADEDKEGATATVRMYRDTGDSSSWLNRLTNIKGISLRSYAFDGFESNVDLPYAGVRKVVADENGGIWVGMYGGGLAYRAADADRFTVYNTTSTPALKTDYVSALAVDRDGGVWFSQNASYTDLTQNKGVGYLKDGAITWYTAGSSTIPENYVQAIEIDADGNVWFGSFGGLTKYDGTTWTTWDESDGLPAASVSAIAIDNDGGVWIGCYPNGAGTETDLFVGGYAHMTAGGTIDFVKEYTGAYNAGVGSSLLADVWVRSIDVDKAGNAWIVRSGSFANMPTSVGGRIDYVTKSGSSYSVQEYTGNSLFADYLTDGIEVRTATVDPKGDLWFGTSGAGLLYCQEGTTVSTHYYSGNMSWNKDNTTLDNIYSTAFWHGTTIYVGSAGGVTVLKNAAAFSDTIGHWGQPYIDYLFYLGIVDGMAKDVYSPDGTLTRAQFVTLLARSTKGFVLGSAPTSGFVDVASGTWFEPYIDWAADCGIVNGIGENKFDPDAYITREDMATVLSRYIKHFGAVLPELGTVTQFDDFDTVSDYAKDAVLEMQKYDIIRGKTPTTFDPKANATRAEAATVITRYLKAAR